MNKYLSLVFIFAVGFTFSACNTKETTKQTPPAPIVEKVVVPEEKVEIPEKMVMPERKVETPTEAVPEVTVLPTDEACRVFFDGCKTCRKMPDGETICSGRDCEEKGAPKCLQVEETVSGSDEPTAEPVVENPDFFATSAYMGLTEDEAQDQAEMEGVSFRVVERDGRPLPATADFRPGRFNASVANGIVVSIQVEGRE